MATDYEPFTGKKATVTRTDGEVLEGTIEAGSPVGIVFKLKGTSQGKLIAAADIKDVVEIVPGPKKLKARTIPQVTEGKHREHLIERHGYQIAEIEKLTEADAKTFHDSLDHSGLGHKHRTLTPAEQAIAEAAQDEQGDED